MSDEWRGVLAVLVNPKLRRALADAIAQTDPPLSVVERSDAHTTLEDRGILLPTGQIDSSRLRELLKADRADPKGVDRWLTKDGRIDHWPNGHADRLELLDWVLDRLLAADEVLPEKQVTERLLALTHDPNTLRRALVDEGLLDRNVDGSDYRRAREG